MDVHIRSNFPVGTTVHLLPLLEPSRRSSATASGAKPTFGSAPAALEFDLLCEPKRIVYFHAEVAHRSFNLGMSEQQLDRS